MDPLRAAAAVAGSGTRPDESQARAMAARELGVTFLTQLMATMRQTIPDGGLLPHSPHRDVLEGVFDRAVAESVSRGDPFGFERRFGAAPAAVQAGASTEGATQPAPASLKVSPEPADRLDRQSLPRVRRPAGGPER